MEKKHTKKNEKEANQLNKIKNQKKKRGNYLNYRGLLFPAPWMGRRRFPIDWDWRGA